MEFYSLQGEDVMNGTSDLVFRLDDENYVLFFDDEGNNATNSSNSSNTYYILHGDSLYPSGYSMAHIIIASIVVTLLMIVVVVGNMLVIIAIATEKALKNIQNWFIASLAVADFFLGLVIMPFSLANEIMGYWIFGNWWCDIHSAMDVLLCTASIMNLCLISLDRYWSITQAVDYLKKRTPLRAAVMITLVWILSGLICIPPLLGWKPERPAVEEFPKCQPIAPQDTLQNFPPLHTPAPTPVVEAPRKRKFTQVIVKDLPPKPTPGYDRMGHMQILQNYQIPRPAAMPAQPHPASHPQQNPTTSRQPLTQQTESSDMNRLPTSCPKPTVHYIPRAILPKPYTYPNLLNSNLSTFPSHLNSDIPN
ncbi:uncharacterized protein [Anabrus simplex]|uniref:uncharacterized protein n=1 Tax=Anabrus simplex TaxID=316456 RepID=UPI0035A362E6